MKDIRNTLLEGISPVEIRTYRQKDIDFLVKRHRELYESEYGFSPAFGDYVEKYLLEFHGHHDGSRENIWVAEMNQVIVGVSALVKVNESTAQLRWFLIEPDMRGRGLGHRLMKTVIDFSKEKTIIISFFGQSASWMPRVIFTGITVSNSQKKKRMIHGGTT